MHGLALLNLGDKTNAKKEFEKALNIVKKMVPEDWGGSYPGNNPNIYKEGLIRMQNTIEENLRRAIH